MSGVTDVETREPASIPELEALSREVRWRIISTVAASGAGHIGGPLSMTDLLVSLYFSHLRIDPATPDDPDRDRFILSKGHCAIGLYSVLALRGYFPVDELQTFDHGDSRLQGHPDMRLTPGVDASTGSLGQGLSVGAGLTLAARMSGRDHRTWVMMGDGEIQEGMVWEAVYFASRHALSNLTAIVDVNGLQQYGWSPVEGRDRFDRSEPWGGLALAEIFRGYRWNVIEVDGHDHAQILAAYARADENARSTDRPTVILARTRKGNGVSFTAGTYRWHNGIANHDQLAVARAELGIEE